MIGLLKNRVLAFVLYLMLALLILSFVINFGPQANEDIGCGAPSRFAMSVEGEGMSLDAERLGRMITSGDDIGSKMTRLNLLFRRYILAKGAKSLGFDLDRETVQGRMVEGDMYALGVSLRQYSSSVCEDGICDEEAINRVRQSIGVSTLEKFVTEQKEEQLAQLMTQMILQTAAASPSSLRVQHRAENEAVSLRIKRFDALAQPYAPTTQEIEAALASRSDDLQKRYDAQQEKRFAVAAKELDLMALFVAAGSDEDKATTLQTVAQYEKAIKSAEDFKSHVESYATKLSGPSALGWQQLSGADLPAHLGDANFQATLTALTKGNVSPAMTTSTGVVLFFANDERAGALTFEQVKERLAKELLVEERTAEIAKSKATSALEELTSSGQSLEEKFPGSTDLENAQLRSLDKNAYRRKVLLSGKSSVGHINSTFTQRTGKGIDTGLGIEIEDADLASKLFSEGKPGVIPKIYESDNAYFIVELIKRNDIDWESFEKRMDSSLYQQATMAGYLSLQTWLKSECERLQSEVEVDPRRLQIQDPVTDKITNFAFKADCAVVSAPNPAFIR